MFTLFYKTQTLQSQRVVFGKKTMGVGFTFTTHVRARWKSRGPTEGRDDRGHESVVAPQPMTGASAARPCQYNSYVSYL